MNCPRCGAKMTNGVCSECGFPITRIMLDRFTPSHNYAIITHILMMKCGAKS